MITPPPPPVKAKVGPSAQAHCPGLALLLTAFLAVPGIAYSSNSASPDTAGGRAYAAVEDYGMRMGARRGDAVALSPSSVTVR